MKIVIKRGSSPKSIKDKLGKLHQRRRKLNLSKYCGSINLEDDPLKIQKAWRDEW